MAVENLTLAPFYTNQRNPFNYVKFHQVSRDITTGWLTLEEITQQLNLFDDESQDSYLTGLELATRMAIEDYLGMAIFPVQYRVYYANPGLYNTALYLDLPEVTPGLSGVKINSVSVWVDAQPPVLQPMACTDYSYDPTGNQVILNAGPNNISQYIANPIEVLYTEAANSIANYPVIKQAGLLLLTHLYNNRADTTVEKMNRLPFGVDVLLRPYKPLVL